MMVRRATRSMNATLRKAMLAGAVLGATATSLGLITVIHRTFAWVDRVTRHVDKGDEMISPIERHLDIDNLKHWSMADRTNQVEDAKRIANLELMLRYLLRREGVDPDTAIAIEKLRDARGNGRAP